MIYLAPVPTSTPTADEKLLLNSKNIINRLTMEKKMMKTLLRLGRAFLSKLLHEKNEKKITTVR